MTNAQLIKKVQEPFLKADRVEYKTGMEVEVSQTIREWWKETAGKTPLEKTITVRRKIGAFGVEKIFAIHSPSVLKIEIIRQFKVRKKSIKFIRDLTGKAARLKEIR